MVLVSAHLDLGSLPPMASTSIRTHAKPEATYATPGAYRIGGNTLVLGT